MENNLAVLFIKWLYWDSPRAILNLIRDFMLWCWNMFSIGFFLPRIFSPWHRDITAYGRGFRPSVWFQAFMFNLISRFFGGVLRIFFIIVGLALEVVIMVAGFALFISWLVLPAILVYLVSNGMSKL